MSGEFAGTLKERVELQRQVAARDAAGLQQFAWQTFATCSAAIQPEGVGAESEAMAISAMPRFRIVLRQRDGIAIDQRIRWKGRLLMIRQLLEDPRLRDRLILRCEEVRQ